MPARLAELKSERFEGQAARNFEIVSDQGHRATFNAVGARLMSLEFPDGFDAVVGPATIGDAWDSEIYAGAICGRFANRIHDSRFVLDGGTIHLGINEPPNHLHGGAYGFHRKVWQSAIEGDALVFTLVSPDNEEGYPGELHARAAYRFDGPVLSCVIEARTDKPTIVNLTNHAYWNLSGEETIHNHSLTVSAGRHTPTDAKLIPTGEVPSVAGTAQDFRKERTLADAFAASPLGFDGNLCLDGERGSLHHAATLKGGGRMFDLYTTEPGVQVYTAGHHGPGFKGKKGKGLVRFGSIALEPQTWPDAPNNPSFPSAVLRPGDVYRHVMEWRFSKT
ncbi:MAG: aldose epimerase family protein [Parvibaculaceae bacterium]